MLVAGRYRLEAGARRASDRLVGKRSSGDVDVAGRFAEQRIAHGSAGNARFLATLIQEREQLLQRGIGEPFRAAGNG